MEPDETPTLDALLTGWAGRHRLAPDRAEAVRRAVRGSPGPGVTVTELPAEWWHAVFGATAAHVRRSAEISRKWTRINANKAPCFRPFAFISG